jgi:hypothetical protein
MPAAIPGPRELTRRRGEGFDIEAVRHVSGPDPPRNRRGNILIRKPS